MMFKDLKPGQFFTFNIESNINRYVFLKTFVSNPVGEWGMQIAAIGQDGYLMFTEETDPDYEVELVDLPIELTKVNREL